MDSKDFPSIFNYFSDKIDQINDLVPLVKACKLEGASEGNDNLPKLSYLSAIVQEMEEMLVIVETELDRQKEDLLTKKDLITKKVESVQDHCNYLVSFKGKYQAPREIKETIPIAAASVVPSKIAHHSTVASHHHPPTAKGTSKSVRKEDNRTKKVTTSTVSENNKAKNHPTTEYKTVKNREIPMVEPINMNEFDEIPQYMRGRITHSSLNQGLAAFMDTITAKYQLLSTHSSRYTDEDMKRAQLYKSQENSDTAGQLFCTTDDLKMYSNLKETNTTKIVLTCLRHCRRIKEIRGPGKLIRYAVVKP
ncbi:spindle and kinetochore-associated protein 1-like [Panonychus citri]|uniref:spindle and kinetochore-associated protein 1-like n=1 Tax=Panonychus citri TaxID=50023 RepID=UPI002307967E|nr:spindle and kinetochore-associated protein 1-like [Panonychus citri]